MSDILEDQFRIGAETPAIWALSARRLKRSGDLLFDAYSADLAAMGGGTSPLKLDSLEIAGPATLLPGLAIENILKAIAIQSDPQPVTDGKLRDWPSSHDLLRLAEIAGVALEQSQSDLLRRMGACVEWAGRYPVPKKATKIARSGRPMSIGHGRLFHFSPASVKRSTHCSVTCFHVSYPKSNPLWTRRANKPPQPTSGELH
ncbi:MAG: hypothetical protein AB7H88_18130 [Vicinamibacterales bacterium]